jgi:hypothetical protein
VKKLFDYLSKFIFIFAVVFFFYGVWKYPDGPIKVCGENRYCGKQGQPHTIEDFEDHNRWNIISMTLIPLAILLSFINNGIKKKDDLEQNFSSKIK